MRFTFAILFLSAMLAACASTTPPPVKRDPGSQPPSATAVQTGYALESGIAAYRANRIEEAWALLNPLAQKNDPRALRQTANILLSHGQTLGYANPEQEAVSRLLLAAQLGDTNALIMLEGMRREQLAYAPAVEQIIKIEKARAKKGDAAMAWRLAKRYQAGDGVPNSEQQAIRWLKIAANTKDTGFPHANDAANQVCEIYADNPEANVTLVRKWCGRAARNGHAAAAVTLARLKIHSSKNQ